jgi:hypothetical protein
MLALWSRTTLAALGLAVLPPDSSPLPANPSHSPGPRRVTIVAREYTFDAPDTLPAGPTVFRLENRGHRSHELVIFAARTGVSAADMLGATNAEERRSMADPPVGVLFAPIGHPVSAELSATLEAGRWYILFCGVRDSVGMPLHFAIGMVDSIYAR